MFSHADIEVVSRHENCTIFVTTTLSRITIEMVSRYVLFLTLALFHAPVFTFPTQFWMEFLTSNSTMSYNIC